MEKNEDMLNQFSRTELLIGKDGVDKLKNAKKQVPGSISFVPSVAGLIIAGEVVKDIIKNV